MDSVRIGLYEKAIPNRVPMKEKLRLARKHGYDFLEMSIDETEDKLARLDMTNEERSRMVSDMFEEGLFIRSICLSGHRKYPLGSEDAKTREKSLEIMRKAIILAYDLGVRIIMIAGYRRVLQMNRMRPREDTSLKISGRALKWQRDTELS